MADSKMLMRDRHGTGWLHCLKDNGTERAWRTEWEIRRDYKRLIEAEELEDNQEGLEVPTTVEEVEVLLQEGQEIVLKQQELLEALLVVEF